MYCATLLFKVLYCKISNVFLPTIWLVGLVAKLCPTLADPIDCSLPGSFAHGILQARILEWVAISSLYSTGSSAQCYVAAWMREEVEEAWIHVYVWLSLFAVYLKLSQHCQLPILQYKITFKNNNKNVFFIFCLFVLYIICVKSVINLLPKYQVPDGAVVLVTQLCPTL